VRDPLLALACFGAFGLTHLLGLKLKIVSPRLPPLLLLAVCWLALLGSLLGRASALPASSMALYLLCLLFYINELMVARDKSPSLEMLRFLDEGPVDGMSAEQLEALFPNDVWIGGRLDYLVRIGQARREGERYFVSPKARLSLRPLNFYRRLIGRGPGG
jgi:hypothetical protein